MSKIIRNIVAIQLIFVSFVGYGQVRKYSNEFLAIGVGARSLGMSNANVVSTNDATSGYWNPSGLLEVKGDLQVAAMHSEYFAGIANYDFGAIIDLSEIKFRIETLVGCMGKSVELSDLKVKEYEP